MRPQALVYNTASSKWIPGTATAGASGTSGLVQFSNGTTLNSDTALYWDNSGKKLGIGTSSPSSTLQVIGTATATTFSGAHSGDGSALTNLSATNLASGTVPAVRLGSGTASASTYLRGDGAWAAVSGGALSSLSDVTLTSPANGNVLTYNGSKWVNANAGTAMGTTTMMPNWPDALKCQRSTDSSYIYLYLTFGPHANGRYIYQHVDSPAVEVIYNADGTFNTSSTITGNCTSSSISQLYAYGQAFNFMGSSLASAAAPAGGVQFNNGSGVLAADSALVWDNTNKRLGVGTAIPSSKLHIIDSRTDLTAEISLQNTNSNGYSSIDIYNETGIKSAWWGHANDGLGNFNYIGGTTELRLQTGGGYPLVATNSGNVGIGTTSPGYKLEVAGDIKATGAGSIGVTVVDGHIDTSAVALSKATWSPTGDYIDLPPGTWLVTYKTYAYPTSGTPTHGWIDARIVEVSQAGSPTSTQPQGAAAEVSCAYSQYSGLTIANYKYLNATGATKRLYIVAMDFTNAGGMSLSTADTWFKSFNAVRVN